MAYPLAPDLRNMVTTFFLPRGRAMVDFPTSLVDFQRRFPDEAACATWLFEARWNRLSLPGLPS
jgi:hypothetical protein